MLTDAALAGLGLVMLLFAGDALVRGAVNLALRIGIPAMLVSLTIVAFGTSAPELLVSVQAILTGAPGLALGNVVGSNIANVLLVLGIPAIISGLATSECETRKTWVMMVAASLAFLGLAYTGVFNWIDGTVLLVLLGIMLVDTWRAARDHRRTLRAAADLAATGAPPEPADEEAIEGADATMPGWKVGLFLVLGLVGLPLGANILVGASVRIAEALAVPETVIGLTLVAVGTSLPELATSVMAAIRRQTDVALGNVIGSNLFNLLAIIGIASFVGPIPVEAATLNFDIWVMVATALALFPFVFLRWNITRPWGVAFTAAYVLYVLMVIS